MNTLVQVFARSPVLGEVKSRLASGVGVERALDIYQQLLHFTLNQVEASGFALEIWMQGSNSAAMSELLATRHQPIAVHAQVGDDLGERMHHALVQGRRRYGQVLLVGSDCIDLSPQRLRLAAEALQSGTDLVLGPSADGGYYLVAPDQSDLQLFNGVTWGSSTVWAESLARTQALGWTLTELPLGHDLDTIDDMRQAQDWGVVR